MKSPLAIGLGVIAVVAVIGGIVAVTHKNSMGNMNMPATSSASSPAVATNAVTIANFAFSPANITVKVGTKVTWTNTDSVGHDIDSSNGSFKSGTLNKGNSYSFTFTKAGTYNYICDFHPYMKATVTVTQ